MPSEPLSPELDVKSSPDVVLKSQFRFKNICTHVCRLSPLPKFSWADSQEVWTLMLQKELLYNRNRRMFDFHPTLQARMRSILLDWIIEVILWKLLLTGFQLILLLLESRNLKTLKVAVNVI